MAYYRSIGSIPPKRHTQHRNAEGGLFYEELMGEEGFSADSSLLYHRGIPSAVVDATPWELPDQSLTENRPLLPRHLKLHTLFPGEEWKGADVVTGRRLVLGNADVRISYVVAGEASPLYRNAIGDECVYVESGAATVETVFGALTARAGDYVILPRATTHRWLPAAGEPLRAYVVEANSHITPPKRYLSRYGQLLEHAPYCERDLSGPGEPLLVDQTDVEVLVKHRGSRGIVGTRYVVPTHPFDVVGWDGCLYPYTFNVSDFEPITGRVHQPPPVHQVWEGQNFVICNFVPRKVDYHPLAVPVPYYHSNVDSDEVMFYCGGDYEARKGSGIGQGSISLHPGGHSHGPQPGAIERALGAESFDELAVMVDTFRPLELGEGGRASEDPGYAWSWSGRGPGVTGIDIPDGSPFGPDNLPYGVFAPPGAAPRVGVRVGDSVVDLSAALGTEGPDAAFTAPVLNPFMAQGRARWIEVRERIAELVAGDVRDTAVHPVRDVTLLLPFAVGDYVDFYASEHHAANLGRLFRPGSDPLTPNWKHLPIGYHGRSGTVVVSGTDVVRPAGQRKAPDDPTPTFGPSVRLDIEAELGFVVGVGSPLGTPIPVDAFAEHVFGALLVNDWSARDLQAWEYVPLGPHLGKSFATSVSPWVVPLLALEAARVPLPGQSDPEPLPYLREAGSWGLDVELAVEWNGEVVSRPPYREMYWSPAQMLAHMTVNGASTRPGDLFASGTISGPEKRQRGAFIELTWGGREPITVKGEERTFLVDGDEVVLSATAPAPGGGRIGFGEVRGRIVAARIQL